MKTFREFAIDYIAAKRAGRHARVVTSSKSYLNRFVGWLEERCVRTPDQLTGASIGHWLAYVRLQRSRHSGLPLRPYTTQGQIGAVRAFIAALTRKGLLSASIMEAFPRTRKVPIMPQSTLKHVEVRKVLRGMPSHEPRLFMLRTIGEMAYTTAARPCEILAMNVRDVCFGSFLVRVLGKGQKERMLPIGRAAMRSLETYVRAVRPLLLRNPREGALWLNRTGVRLSYDRLLAMLHQQLGSSGKRITWYTFRRSCATELARAGANPWAIKELLGHDHIETLRHYVHLSLEELRKAHDRCHPRNFSDSIPSTANS